MPEELPWNTGFKLSTQSDAQVMTQEIWDSFVKRFREGEMLNKLHGHRKPKKPRK